MGLDFTALIRYGGPSGDVLPAIADLECGAEEAALAEVVACGLRNDFAFAKYAPPEASWRPLADCHQRLLRRPTLPTLEACLDLPSDFSLTFGRDTVWVYHTLRWLFFVTEAEWQRVMLAAVKRFCELLGASDCIITNDCHPAVLAFRDGAGFAEALEVASRQGEGEVASLGELYWKVEDDSELALKPVRGPAAEYLEGQIVLWPRGKPLPEGWSRPAVWDSKGFWRYQWQRA
jgi:hypothetical protein